MKCSIILGFVLFVTKAGLSQVTFNNSYNTGYDNLFSCEIKALEDSGFVFVNYVRDSATSRQDFSLMRISKDGSVLGTKTINVFDQDFLLSLSGLRQFILNNKGTAFLSGTESQAGEFGAVICKVSCSTLDTIRTVSYYEPGYNITLSNLFAVSPNKVLLLGTKWDDLNTWPFFLELDSNLTIKKTVQVNTSQMLNTVALYNYLTKKIVVGGRKAIPYKPFRNVSFMELDTSGAITNTYVSAPTLSLGVSEMYVSAIDSTYVVVGAQDTYNFNNSYGYSRLNISKYDFAFKLQWRKSYAAQGEYNELTSATILPDGSIVAAGRFGQQGTGATNAVVLKVDRNGIPQWLRQHYELAGLLDCFTSIEQTLDGGLIATGDAQGQYGKAWVVKMDSLGCVAQGCTNYSISVDSLLLDPPKTVDTTNTTGFGRNLRQDYFRLFPNPCPGFCGVEFSIRNTCPDLLLRVIDLFGVIQKEIRVMSETGKQPIDVTELSPGVYIVEASNACSLKTLKLIKE